MNEKMKRFLNSIGIEDIDSFDMDFDLISYDMFNKKQLNMVIVKSSPWDYELLRIFQDHLLTITYPYKITFSYSNKPTFSDVKSILESWYQTIYRVPNDFEIINGGENNIEIVYKNLQSKKLNASRIKDFKEFMLFISYDFLINEKCLENEDNSNEIVEKKIDPVIDLIEQEKQKLNKEVSEALKVEIEKRRIYEEEQLEKKRRMSKGHYTNIEKIADLNEQSGNVAFKATIFAQDSKVYNGISTYNILVNDEFDDAIKITFKENKQIKEAFSKLGGINLHQNVLVKGCVFLEAKSGELVIQTHYLDPLEDTPVTPDDAEIKRVELHLHSNMSTQDGIPEMGDVISYAKALGYKSIALTDHGVVQAFPDAQNAVKKDDDFKVIYGCELYLVDDRLPFIINPSDASLKKSTFVVLDLETTGLSPRHNRMIEFGAVKVSDGLEISSLDILVNPEIPLPERITELTHITNEMLADKKTAKDVLQDIVNYIGDSIIVTHNAQFDFYFLQEELRRADMPLLTNPVIDTLAISRYMYPTNKRHTLGALCKNMEVLYDEDDAHRADYDARVLNVAWQTMLEKLLEHNKEMKHKDFDSLPMNKEILSNVRPYHCCVLVKNQEGIRDLYELISLSHTKYFGGGVPRVPRSELNRLRKNLLVGSGCSNGDVWEYSRFPVDILKKTMDFYDYIEVQPPENLSYILNRERFDQTDIMNSLSDIISAGEEMGKLVVATGDVHYLRKKDKIFRDVYISSLVVGKGRHPLYPGSMEITQEDGSKIKVRKKVHIPDQHLRTTNEMLECFNFLPKEKAYEIVVTNTNKINDLIEKVIPAANDNLCTPEIAGCADKLKEICFNTLHEKFGDNPPQIILDRLNKELSGIITHGYAVIYYIAHMLVKKTNDAGYIVGSRGSVGSSFVATMAGITEVNPLPPYYLCPHCHHFEFGEESYPDIRCGYDLPPKKCPVCGEDMIMEGSNIPFETFLGFNAEKVPDIDLNFPRDFQATAHEFTKELVGEHNVYRAGTIGTIKDKTAFIYAKGYIEDLYGEEVAKTYSHTKLEYIASGCIDVKRTTGQHPGGIVVLPEGREIYEFTPVQYPADDLTNPWVTTHFDFDKIHDTLLKLDMLGHLDPMVIKMMCDLTGVELKTIPFNDQKALSLFSSVDALGLHNNYLNLKTGALGLPEFGTDNTIRTLEETLPKTFEDLVIISGLSHGTGVWAGNAENLIQQGIATLTNVIGCRDDIMTYLMSKGIEPKTSFEIMETVRKKNKFLSEAQVKIMKDAGIPDYYIESANKIEYLFPKGHATAYVTMAVRVAYFKIYYPLEFYAAFFSIRCDQFDIKAMIGGEKEIIKVLDELKAKGRNLSTKEKEINKTLKVALEMVERGYSFTNIDLYRSDTSKFVVDHEHKALIPPFVTIEGLGVNNAATVIEARKDGKFFSKDELLHRTSLSQTNVKDLDALGVLKDLPDNDEIGLELVF